MIVSLVSLSILSTLGPIQSVEPISPQCACKSNKSGKIYDFCYSVPNLQLVGKRFDCGNVELAEELGVLGGGTVDTSNGMIEPVFITAFDTSYQPMTKAMINSFREYFPNAKLIAYSLGGNVADDIRKSCNVEIRNFDFNKYGYRRNLKEYRWKPIIIAETAREFGSIFWMDSSARFFNSDIQHVFDHITRCTNSYACEQSQYLLFQSSGHGIYPVVTPGMYDFLPTDIDRIKNVTMHDANFALVLNTDDVVRKILKWDVLCAMEKDCMAPPGSELFCKFGADRHTEYARCHRFDQSAINLLLTNEYGFDEHLYCYYKLDFYKILRGKSASKVNEKYVCK